MSYSCKNHCVWCLFVSCVDCRQVISTYSVISLLSDCVWDSVVDNEHFNIGDLEKPDKDPRVSVDGQDPFKKVSSHFQTKNLLSLLSFGIPVVSGVSFVVCDRGTGLATGHPFEPFSTTFRHIARCPDRHRPPLWPTPPFACTSSAAPARGGPHRRTGRPAGRVLQVNMDGGMGWCGFVGIERPIPHWTSTDLSCFSCKVGARFQVPRSSSAF